MRTVRTLQAARADVFEAWTDPSRLRTWWGPPGIAVPSVEGECRVGGRFRIVMEGPDGERRTLVWRFVEIVAPERLVYGWQWADGPEAGPESLVTVEFREAGPERTTLELTHTGIDDPAIERNHEVGWAACLDGLTRAA
jgi:uncharacterized protein YndB with AHSA1/START domain